MKRFNALLAVLIVFTFAGCSDDDNKETPLPADQINEAICKQYDKCGILGIGLDITHEQCLVQVGNERTNDAKKYPLCSDALDDLNRCLIKLDCHDLIDYKTGNSGMYCAPERFSINECKEKNYGEI